MTTVRLLWSLEDHPLFPFFFLLFTPSFPREAGRAENPWNNGATYRNSYWFFFWNKNGSEKLRKLTRPLRETPWRFFFFLSGTKLAWEDSVLSWRHIKVGHKTVETAERERWHSSAWLARACLYVNARLYSCVCVCFFRYITYKSHSWTFANWSSRIAFSSWPLKTVLCHLLKQY